MTSNPNRQFQGKLDTFLEKSKKNQRCARQNIQNASAEKSTRSIRSQREIFQEFSGNFSLYNYSCTFNEDVESLIQDMRTIGDESLFTSHYMSAQEQDDEIPEEEKEQANPRESLMQEAMKIFNKSFFGVQSHQELYTDGGDNDDGYNNDDESSFDSLADLQSVVSALTMPSFNWQSNQTLKKIKNNIDLPGLATCVEDDSTEDTTYRSEDPIIPSFFSQNPTTSTSTAARKSRMDCSLACIDEKFRSQGQDQDQDMTDHQSVALMKLFGEVQGCSNECKISLWKKMVFHVARFRFRRLQKGPTIRDNSGAERLCSSTIEPQRNNNSGSIKKQVTKRHEAFRSSAPVEKAQRNNARWRPVNTVYDLEVEC
jgi:hypothetical protein